MKVLVLGSGGREQALVWRLNQDRPGNEVLVAPGNPGSDDQIRRAVNLTDPAGMLALAEHEQVDLTVVGPEAPLEHGVADLFRAHGRAILGPSRQGAALECSKVFAKDFMVRHRIPTARFVVCDDAESALAAVSGGQFGFPVVVKADGLAAGKGVVVAETLGEAEAAVRAAMVDHQFGAAGARLVVEECLTGPEVSFFVLCDGTRAIPLSTAQDHKRIWDNDRGPNTGGMGAFSPSPLVDAALSDVVMDRIVAPVLDGMRQEGAPYIGFLYVGLMLTADGPMVIEFNVRFGDPEAQVVLPLLQGAFAQSLFAAATGDVSRATLKPSDDRAVGVVLASRGYPTSTESGQVIHGLDVASAHERVLIFHSGTGRHEGEVVTAGGRVITVVGRAATYERAMAAAYDAARAIHFDGMHFRSDIGRKAIAATEVRS